MRLGSYDCHLTPDTLAYRAYGKQDITERHRHRYEFNNAFLQAVKENGMQVSGVNLRSQLVEIIELIDHPWVCGRTIPPEFKSRPTLPHPLFREFIAAAKAIRQSAQTKAEKIKNICLFMIKSDINN